jgi:hypothetical protein
MVRRTGRRDRGVRGILDAVADNGARAAGGGATARVRAVPAGFTARVPGGERGKTTGVPKGINELSGKVLKTRVIY